MSNKGFNPEDIEDTLSRFDRGHKKSARPATAGIPRFVPREPAIPNNVNTPQNDAAWAEAADRAEQQQAQELPPASPCFSQADIDEFLARKPKKYQMTERDYKELGRNMVLGAGDLFFGAATTAVVSAEIIAEVVTNSPKMRQSSYEYGYMGWGWYYEDGSFAS
ncbi:hypothetical protein [Salmonella enterica]|uniref:hypothetical protein n=1 Tax=Salmonella enterica TaxID=28901 RepID=UPI0006D49E0C|nr:hypothetical protein [Salmonella enterica]CUR95037.1 Uncharacterised protein [Salmonella enterica subsp. enterica serovar Weltevreden]